MVLEQLFSLPLIEKKPWYALFIGFTYTIIGLGLAVWIFGEDPALVAVAFTALLLFPTLRRLLHEPKSKEQIKDKIQQKIYLGSTKKEAKNDLSRLQFYDPLIYKAQEWMRGTGQIKIFFSTFGEIMGLYFLFFLGMFLAFAFFAIQLDSLASNHIFENQLDLYKGGSGKTYSSGAASFNTATFERLLVNNFGVMILCFITSFIFGDGAIFILAWNASVWGTIFGMMAKTVSSVGDRDPLIIFGFIFVIVFWHMMLEAMAYFGAATAGTVLSKAVIEEKLMSAPFGKTLMWVLLFLFAGFVILVLGAVTETFVLNNVEIYQKIIMLSQRV